MGVLSEIHTQRHINAEIGQTQINNGRCPSDRRSDVAGQGTKAYTAGENLPRAKGDCWPL